MAFALTQGNIFVAFELEDADGNITTRRIQLVWDTDMATTLANAAAVAASLRAITDAAINKYTVSLVYDEGTPEVPGGEIQEVAHLVLSLNLNPPTGLSKTKVFEVPAPTAGIRVAASGPGSNIIDITDADLLTFLTHFEAGNEAYLSHGQTLDTIKDGYVHHIRSKRG